MQSFKRVPLLKVGEWPIGRSDDHEGKTAVTRADLESFVRIFESGKYPRPVGGLAHREDRDANGLNGTPALADVENLVVDVDTDGVETLFVDILNVPDWVAKRYPRRSAEWHITSDGEFVLHRVGFMGDEYPAIDTLADMEALTTDEGPALALAAGAVLCAAAVDDITASPLGADQPDEGPGNNEEGGSVVDLNELRESLGLAEGTSDEDILAAAIERAQAANTTSEPEGEEPEANADKDTEPAGDPADPRVETIDAEVLAELRAKAELGEQAHALLLEQEADQLVTAAFAEAKITEKGKAGYKADLLAGGTRREEALVLLTAAAADGGLAPGRTGAPVGAMVGHAVTATAAAANGGQSDDEFYKALYGSQEG